MQVYRSCWAPTVMVTKTMLSQYFQRFSWPIHERCLEDPTCEDTGVKQCRKCYWNFFSLVTSYRSGDWTGRGRYIAHAIITGTGTTTDICVCFSTTANWFKSKTRKCTLWRCKSTPTPKAKLLWMTLHYGPTVVRSVTEIPFHVFIW